MATSVGNTWGPAHMLTHNHPQEIPGALLSFHQAPWAVTFGKW